MRRQLKSAAWASLLALSLVGCFGNEETEFPDGLEPLEENDLAPPEGTADDPYPEEFVLEGMSSGRYDIVLGRGYIQAPLVDVWAAYREPAVGADRRTTSGEWSPMAVEDSTYDDEYIIHHIARDIVTVEWDVTWRHGVVTGTVEEPELVAIRWQKTNGSTLIRIIEGSLVLRPVGDGSVTEVELAYHASATGASLDTYVRYMGDIYDDAVATVHGEALPTY
ncbi:MAG: hypothetical protein RID81_16560 [Sandaracinaceae bacterium]